MTTTTETSPLAEIHESLGVNWLECKGLAIPGDYGDLSGEYAAFDEGCAVMDRSDLGRIRISGSTAQDFLHRMTSAPVNNLQVSDGMESIVTTSEGRFVDWVTIYKSADDHLVMVTGAGAAPEVIDFFEGYIFFKEDVTFEDTSEGFTQLQLSGAGALELSASLGFDLSEAGICDIQKVERDGSKFWAARINDVTGEDLHLFCESRRSKHLWEALQSADVKWRPVGYSAYNTRRIEAGLPVYPNEINEKYMMLEAHLMGAVDLESGCFNGQEVVARTYNYDKIKQHLCRLELENGSELSPPVRIYSDERRIGTLTSCAPKINGDGWVALGYIKTKFVEDGLAIRVGEDRGVHGKLLTKTSER